MMRANRTESGMMKRGVIWIVLMTVGLATGLAQAQPKQNQPAPAQPPAPADTAKQREWADAMHKTKLPKDKGCFEAKYPATTWKEVTCKKAPKIPMIPASGAIPATIGNGNDVAALVPSGSGPMKKVIGSFDSASGATQVTSGGVAGAYSLQLNTRPFTTTTCAGATVPANCKGWQQFVYVNDGVGGSLYIEYWLLKYSDGVTACPTGWTAFTQGADTHCRRTSGATSAGAVSIASLTSISLSGTADGTSENAVFYDGTANVTAM